MIKNHNCNLTLGGLRRMLAHESPEGRENLHGKFLRTRSIKFKVIPSPPQLLFPRFFNPTINRFPKPAKLFPLTRSLVLPRIDHGTSIVIGDTATVRLQSERAPNRRPW
jgi:hypothetical protein